MRGTIVIDQSPVEPPGQPGIYRWDGHELQAVSQLRVSRLLLAVAGICVALVIGVGIGRAIGTTSTTTASTVPSAVPSAVQSAIPAPVPTPIELSGQGSEVPTVHLIPGRYKVSWTAQGHDNFIVILHEAQDVHLVNQVPPDPASGEAFLPVSNSGDYPLEVQAATLTWTLTFTRI
jgi:hypothetical protein